MAGRGSSPPPATAPPSRSSRNRRRRLRARTRSQPRRARGGDAPCRQTTSFAGASDEEGSIESSGISGTAPLTLASRARSARVVDVVAIGGVLAGIGLRAWALASPTLGSLDSDEAVWGLQARHLLHGEWSTFFWGQPYGGSQETILTAGVFGLFGTSTLALKLVPTVLYALAAALVWRVGRQTVGEPAARVAAVLFWIWPAYFVWRSTKAFGFYGSGLVLELGVALLALRLRERRSVLGLALLGLALGLGWWATPQIVILAVPALAWLVWVRPRLVRDSWIVAPAFVVGALPWLVWNARNGWGSLHSTQARTSELGHARNLFTSVLPTALGLRVPFSLGWIVGPVVGWAAFLLALAGLAWLVWRRPRGLGVLLLACPVFLVVYVVSPFTYLGDEPRYVTMFQPVIALLVAWGLCRFSRPWPAVGGTAAALALSLAGLVSMERHELTVQTVNAARVPTETASLIRALERAGARTAYADYWVAYLVDFDSRERLVVTPAPLTGVTRNLAWAEEVRRSRSPAHVFVRGGGREERARPRLLREGYRRVRVGGFDVYVRPAASARAGSGSARAPARRSPPKTEAATSASRASSTASRATTTQAIGSSARTSW